MLSFSRLNLRYPFLRKKCLPDTNFKNFIFEVRGSRSLYSKIMALDSLQQYSSFFYPALHCNFKAIVQSSKLTWQLTQQNWTMTKMTLLFWVLLLLSLSLLLLERSTCLRAMRNVDKSLSMLMSVSRVMPWQREKVLVWHTRCLQQQQ